MSKSHAAAQFFSNAQQALDYWDAHPHTTVFYRSPGHYAAVEEAGVETFRGFGWSYGWVQTSPEEIENGVGA